MGQEIGLNAGVVVVDASAAAVHVVEATVAVEPAAVAAVRRLVALKQYNGYQSHT